MIRRGELRREPGPGFIPEGRTDGKVGSRQSGGRPSMSCGEAIKRLDEDAPRAQLIPAEESADCDLKPDLMAEDGFLGKPSTVAIVDSPALSSTRGTG